MTLIKGRLKPRPLSLDLSVIPSVMKRQNGVTFDPSAQRRKWDTAKKDVAYDAAAYKLRFGLHRGLQIFNYLMLKPPQTDGFSWADWQRGRGGRSCPGSWPLELDHLWTLLKDFISWLADSKQLFQWFYMSGFGFRSILYSTQNVVSYYWNLKPLFYRTQRFLFLTVLPWWGWRLSPYISLICHVTCKFLYIHDRYAEQQYNHPFLDWLHWAWFFTEVCEDIYGDDITK